MKVYGPPDEDFSVSLPLEITHPSTSWAMIWGDALADPTGLTQGTPAGWRSLYRGDRSKALYASLKTLARHLPDRPIRAGTAAFEWQGVVDEVSCVETDANNIEHVVLAVRPYKRWSRTTEAIGPPVRPSVARDRSTREHDRQALVGHGAYRAWATGGGVQCLYGGITAAEADALGLRVETELASGTRTFTDYEELRALYGLTEASDHAA